MIILQAEKRECEMKEQSRIDTKNMSKYDDFAAKNQQRRKVE